VNVNVPISILSYGSNNGDVHQSNYGRTNSSAENDNITWQGNTQTQNGSAKGGAPSEQGKDWGKDGGKPCDHPSDNGEGRDPKSDGGASVEQDQNASNDNSTSQSAESQASNEQANYNAPFSLFSGGSEQWCDPCRQPSGGEVEQTNVADTASSASNDNRTGQGNTQTQDGSAG